jgi:NitT/TauT family transport system permease protein
MARSRGSDQVKALRIPPELIAVVAAFALWELAVDLVGLPRVVLPSPSLVIEELAQNTSYYVVQSLHTLENTLAAFALAVIFGVAMAIGIVYSRLLERTVYALLVAVNNVPKVALAPLFVIWLGTGNASKIGMAFLIAIFAIVIDAVLGLRSLDPDLIDLGRSMRGSPLKMLIKIRFPNALPSIFAGMKVALSLALVGEIVGEFVAAQKGLGFVILSAQGLFRTDRVFAAILLLALIGTVLYYAMEFAERRILPWHSSHRSRHVAV